MELEFTAFEADGKQFKFKLNDSEIDYLSIREHIPESLCIDAIEKIKKESGKKCALIFGNCQTPSLRKILLRHLQFSKEYFFISVPAVYLYKKEMLDLTFGGGEQFLQLVDLFISQHVKQKNRFGVQLSTKNITSKLSESCKILWIPSIYFEGYFPQRVRKDANKAVRTSIRFPVGDCYIGEMMEGSGMNPDIDAIIDKIDSPNFIPAKRIQDKIDMSLTELEKREWFCEVKISDYVENNIFGRQIFSSMNHPMMQILMEVARRILRSLGMHSDIFLDYKNLVDDSNFEISLIGMDIPIYSSVAKFFDFHESLDIYWANRWIWNFKGNFREFQREYIRQCWAEKFTR